MSRMNDRWGMPGTVEDLLAHAVSQRESLQARIERILLGPRGCIREVD